MYDLPQHFEPLLPSASRQEPLLAKAHDLSRAAIRLAGQSVATELRGLLRAMIDYVLDICLDQVQFMSRMLALETLERRMAACLTFEQETLRSGVRVEALRPLHYLVLSGLEMERGEFKRMTGLGDRTAVSLLMALLRRGLLRSDSPQGKVRFGVPLHALRFYFPALWPEAEADDRSSPA